MRVYHSARKDARMLEVTCYCSMILSGVKCSGKMSFYEGRDNHLEHARTETSDGLESDPSWAIERGTSGRSLRPVSSTRATHLGGLSKGGARRARPWEPRSQARSSDQ